MKVNIKKYKKNVIVRVVIDIYVVFWIGDRVIKGVGCGWVLFVNGCYEWVGLCF